MAAVFFYVLGSTKTKVGNNMVTGLGTGVLDWGLRAAMSLLGLLIRKRRCL